MENLINIFFVILIWIIAIPTILSIALCYVGRLSKTATVRFGGFYGQIIFGGLGVMIHELSHLLMALLFRHHITGFRLLHIPRKNDPNDRALGYVNHTWNPQSFYQQVGNLFIGIAPLFGGIAALLATFRWLTPGMYDWWLTLMGSEHLVIANQTPWWQYLIAIILVIHISVGCFDLSRADLQNSKQGLIVALGLVVVITLILSLLMSASTFQTAIFSWFPVVYWAFALAIACNLLVLLAFYLMYLFKR